LFSAVFTELDFVLPHGLSIATSLPQKQVNLRYYAFLCVTMIEARKAAFCLAKWPFQSRKADVAEW
jgi:hypothetical protein